MLTGLRGVGKTVLLGELGLIAERRGWVHQYHEVDATGYVPFPRTMAKLVRKALLRLSAGQRLAERAQRALGVLKSFQVQWKLPGGGDLMVGLDTGFFRFRMGRTTNAERDYLAAMASLGSGPYNSGDVAAAMGKTTAQVGPHRSSLIKKGLCYSPRHGAVAFTVPKFDDFLRRNMM